MFNLLKKIAEMADKLDQNGFTTEADALEQVLLSMAEQTEARKFDILRKHVVKVPNSVLSKFEDPTSIPEKYIIKVDSSLLVREANDVQVFDSKVLHKDEFSGKSLVKAKEIADAKLKELLQKFSPATHDEQIDYMGV